MTFVQFSSRFICSEMMNTLNSAEKKLLGLDWTVDDFEPLSSYFIAPFTVSCCPG